MDRLTIKDVDYSKIGVVENMRTAILSAAMCRLAAYEDKGLTPEQVEAMKIAMMGKSLAEIKEINGLSVDRMIELAQAEAEGRLIVLPCKVGDTVYYLTGINRSIIKSATVIGITIDCDGICDIYVKNEDGVEFWHEFDIFHLTREAAEAALKEAQQG